MSDERSPEIDIDLFGSDAFDPPPPQHAEEANEPPAAVRFANGALDRSDQMDPFEAAMREHEQMVLTSEEAEHRPHPRNVTNAPLPTAVIWPSRTGGETPHVVTLALWHCTCEAAVLGNRDCWAIAEAKRLFGDAR